MENDVQRVKNLMESHKDDLEDHKEELSKHKEELNEHKEELNEHKEELRKHKESEGETQKNEEAKSVDPGAPGAKFFVSCNSKIVHNYFRTKIILTNDVMRESQITKLHPSRAFIRS